MLTKSGYATMSELLKIYFLSSNVHSCFFYFNDTDKKNSKCDKRAIKLRFGANHQNVTYGSVSPTALKEVPSGCLGVSSLYGSKLGLKEKQVVLVSYCDADSISTLQILPRKEEDYVILLNCKSILETYLLNQLSVVAEGQILPIYVFSNICVDVEIGKVNLSSGYGQLEKFTEIEVLHPSEKVNGTVKSELNVPVGGETGKEERGKGNFLKIIHNNLSSILENKVSSVKIEEQRSQEIILKNLIEKNVKNHEKVYKVKPTLLLSCDLPKKIKEKCIIVSNLENENSFGSYCVRIFAKVEEVSNLVSENNGDDENDEISKKCSSFLHCFVIGLNNNNSNTAYCPSFVMKKLKLKVGSIITIKKLELIESAGKNMGSILNNDFESVGCFWNGIKKVRESVKEVIMNNFRFNYKINSLIIGEPGTGKTFLLTDIVNEFRNEFIHCEVLRCKSLRGKKVDTLHQLFVNHLTECIYQEPSLLILDDLHALIYVNDEEDEFNKQYSRRVGDLISSMMEEFQGRYNITVIASAASLPQLSAIVSRHGPRLFQNVVNIPEMNLSERNFTLKCIINRKIGIVTDGTLDLDKISSSTNGYTIQNLCDLVDKAIFNSLLRSESETLSNISQDDFALAFSESTPFSLRSVKLKQNIDRNWDDVGGMMEPKKILTEVFSWPLKYPKLLDSCPLRLQRGVLLYGAPGTGKTLLAGALASRCGLNFISVKGPEVLSKYVGASEEGVRSLFIQAQKTRPCLLFFDEFDSLAPKRGHDSSGVTDRVVNQILTELDGVESLSGVWVLAATSRPDLLDSALLRPGRLDKLVFCDTPNQVDRLSILEVLSKNMEKEENVSLLEIAEKTEGYTGADLQAVLYNAQMSAIKKMKNSLEKKSKIKISQSDFQTALSEVKPSMSSSEKITYNKIYAKFLNSRKKGEPENYNMKQIITLA